MTRKRLRPGRRIKALRDHPVRAAQSFRYLLFARNIEPNRAELRMPNRMVVLSPWPASL
jgi:hypothetical protein